MQKQEEYLILRRTLTRIINTMLATSTVGAIVKSVLNKSILETRYKEKEPVVTIILPKKLFGAGYLVQTFDPEDYLYNWYALTRMVVYNAYAFSLPFLFLFLLYLISQLSYYLYLKLLRLLGLLKNIFGLLKGLLKNILNYYRKNRGLTAEEWKNEFMELKASLVIYLAFKLPQMNSYLKSKIRELRINIYKIFKKIIFSLFILTLTLILYILADNLWHLKRNFLYYKKHFKYLDRYNTQYLRLFY